MSTDAQSDDDVLEDLLQTAVGLGMSEKDAEKYSRFVSDGAMSMPTAISTVKMVTSLLKELNEKLKEADEEKSHLLKESSEMSRLLKEEQCKTTRLKEGSIETAYGKIEGGFKMPNLKINKGVKPSTNQRDTELKPPTPLIVVTSKEHWVNTAEITIPVMDAENQIISSILGSKYRNAGYILTYANEYGIQAYCMDMIKDALCVLGFNGEHVEAHVEISLYMMRPDIVLVLRHGGRVFFAVEIKSPSEDEMETSLYENQNVAGQIWSYLYAMKAAGLDNPIGAIMTYNTIALVTLEDYTNIEQHKARLEKTKKELSQGISPQRELNRNETKCGDRKKSPVKQQVSYSENTKALHDKSHSFEDVEMPLKVFYSPIHYKPKVFPFLLQGISVAYQSVAGSRQDKLTVLKNGDVIGGRMVYKVGRQFYTWVALRRYEEAKNDDEKESPRPLCAKIDSSKLPRRDTEYLYVLCKIGEGGKSSVYLACSGTGQVCVIKDYYTKPSAKLTDSERNEEEQENAAVLKRAVEDEQSRWEYLYKERLPVRIIQLGEKACLLLPYGYEITDDVGSRWMYVPAVRDELARFAKGSYVYKESDLHWRQVLLDTSGSIFLCDLESLEVVFDNDADRMVYNQLELLLSCMVNHESVETTEQWVRDLSNSEHLSSLIASTPTLKEFFIDSYVTTDELVDVASFLARLDTPENPKYQVALYMIDHYLSCPEPPMIENTGQINCPLVHSSPDSVCDLNPSSDWQRSKRQKKKQKKTKCRNYQ